MVFNKECFILIGYFKYVFLLYLKFYRYDEYGLLLLLFWEIVFWYKYIFYFMVKNEKVVLEMGSIDVKIGLYLDYFFL